MSIDTPPTVVGLRCRLCGAERDVGLHHVCGECFGPLEPVYDTEAIGARISRERIAAGPSSLWRYRDLLPVLAGGVTPADLGAGLSPLKPAPRLADELGLSELWLKDDTRTPSGSFKDRVVTVAMTAARALDVDTVACASTGNLANAVSAHAAATGMPAYVFIPHDLERGKIVGAAVYGANVVSVEGTYDQVNRLASEVADGLGWGFVNVNLRPYYAEGSKTIGFEIAEQLGWQLPDHVVIPVASGSMLTKVHKAFGELAEHGLPSGDEPRISGAQPAGCAPVADAYERDSLEVKPVREPDTIARSLAIGDPADGYFALQAVAETDGAVGRVPDEEIVAGIRLLAETEGIFAETAGGVTVANLRRFVEQGTVGSDERVVAVISGNGYKTLEAVEPHVGPSFETAPSYDAFVDQLE